MPNSILISIPGGRVNIEENRQPLFLITLWQQVVLALLHDQDHAARLVPAFRLAGQFPQPHPRLHRSAVCGLRPTGRTMWGSASRSRTGPEPDRRAAACHSRCRGHQSPPAAPPRESPGSMRTMATSQKLFRARSAPGPRRRGSHPARPRRCRHCRPEAGHLKRFAFDPVHRIKCKTQHTQRRACLGLPSI